MTELLVTALEDGVAGDVIRCRSSLDGALLFGRLQAGMAAELVLNAAISQQSAGAW